MKNRLLIALTTFLLTVLYSQRVVSAETNRTETTAAPNGTNAAAAVGADLKDLVSRINTKLDQDKTNETDLADNIKEFDALLAKHKDAPPPARAQILTMKANLYLQVLGEPEKALAVFKQIKSDFPTVRLNGNTDDVINMLQSMVEKNKIRSSLVPGAPFPDFNEQDLEGKPLAISNYKGKVVLVDFWATWCPPCVLELPKIQEAYNKYHDQGFEVVGISLDEDKARLEQFVKEKKMPWPEFFDGKKWENRLAVKYGVEQTPTGYLLDREGRIIATPTAADDLDSEIAKALTK